MRAVLQRVTRAAVRVEGETVGKIGRGLLVLLGIGLDDTDADARYLVEKIVSLRIFDDAAGRMNESLAEAEGALLVVSQFTLYGGGISPGKNHASVRGGASLCNDGRN